MTDERKNEIIKDMAYRSKEDLVRLVELLTNPITNDEEVEYVLQSIKNEILSRMSH